jgi:CNT family concentrative nucleoside transporter
MAHATSASLKRLSSGSLPGSASKEKIPVHTVNDEVEEVAHEEKQQSRGPYPKLRPYILTAGALFILGWWLSATILKATRGRWYALGTLFALLSLML